MKIISNEYMSSDNDNCERVIIHPLPMRINDHMSAKESSPSNATENSWSNHKGHIEDHVPSVMCIQFLHALLTTIYSQTFIYPSYHQFALCTTYPLVQVICCHP